MGISAGCGDRLVLKPETPACKRLSRCLKKMQHRVSYIGSALVGEVKSKRIAAWEKLSKQALLSNRESRSSKSSRDTREMGGHPAVSDGGGEGSI
jgi:hypothetical protein